MENNKYIPTNQDLHNLIQTLQEKVKRIDEDIDILIEQNDLEFER